MQQKEIMRLPIGSIIHPGVEIWYKGERAFWFEGDGPFVVSAPLCRCEPTKHTSISLRVKEKEGDENDEGDTTGARST